MRWKRLTSVFQSTSRMPQITCPIFHTTKVILKEKCKMHCHSETMYIKLFILKYFLKADNLIRLFREFKLHFEN